MCDSYLSFSLGQRLPLSSSLTSVTELTQLEPEVLPFNRLQQDHLRRTLPFRCAMRPLTLTRSVESAPSSVYLPTVNLGGCHAHQRGPRQEHSQWPPSVSQTSRLSLCGPCRDSIVRLSSWTFQDRRRCTDIDQPPVTRQTRRSSRQLGAVWRCRDLNECLARLRTTVSFTQEECEDDLPQLVERPSSGQRGCSHPYGRLTPVHFPRTVFWFEQFQISRWRVRACGALSSTKFNPYATSDAAGLIN